MKTSNVLVLVALMSIAQGARVFAQGVTLPTPGHTSTQVGGGVHDSTWGATLGSAGNRDALSGAGSEVQYLSASENDGNPASIIVPFDADEVTITFQNTIPPVWGGDIANYDSYWPNVVYNHAVVVTAKAGSTIQTTSFAQLGPTPLLRRYGQGCSTITWFGVGSFYDCKRGYGSVNMTGGYDWTLKWGGNDTSGTGTHFPQIDTSSTGSLTLHKVPAGTSIVVNTTMTLYNFEPTATTVTSTSQPGSMVQMTNTLPAQGGADIGCSIIGSGGCMDGRYSNSMVVQNRDSWDVDYLFKVTGGSAATAPTSCPAYTMHGTFWDGTPCSGDFPAEPIGYTTVLSCTKGSTRNNFSTCQADGTQSPVTTD